MKLKPEQLLPEEIDVLVDNALNCYINTSDGVCPHCKEKIRLLRHIAWLNEIIEDLWKEYANG